MPSDLLKTSGLFNVHKNKKLQENLADEPTPRNSTIDDGDDDRDDVNGPLGNEYKSKWDQFCDFTSLTGFRLLGSKFTWTIRLSVALAMITGATVLVWSFSRIFYKYTTNYSSLVVHEEAIEGLQLPNVMLCFQNQFARAGLSASVLEDFDEDLRRIVFNFVVQGTMSNISWLTELDFTPNNRATFNTVQKFCNDNKDVISLLCLYYKNWTEFSVTQNYTNLLTFKRFGRTRGSKNECINATSDDSYVSCVLRLTNVTLYRILNVDLDYYVDQLYYEYNDFMLTSTNIMSHNAVAKSRYGTCHDLHIDPETQNASMLLDTFGYDSYADRKIILIIRNGVDDPDYYHVLEGYRSSVVVTGVVSITNQECYNKYPSECRQTVLPYSQRECYSCMHEYMECSCSNPFRRTAAFPIGRRNGVIRPPCTLLESIECNNKLRRLDMKPVSSCTDQCATTNHVIRFLISKTPFLANYHSPNVIKKLNRLAYAVEQNTVIFNSSSYHEMWHLIGVTREYLSEAYFGFFLDILRLIYVRKHVDDIILNITIDTFMANLRQYVKKNPELETYHNFVSACMEKVFENFTDDTNVVQWCMEYQFITNKKTNPVALANFYDNEGVLERFKKVLSMLNATGRFSKYFDENGAFNENTQKNTWDCFEQLERFTVNKYESLNYAQVILRLSNVLTNETYTYYRTYTAWYMLADVGGILGLLFGLTLITIYEIIAFTFIDREKAIVIEKPVKLTRRTLYPRLTSTSGTDEQLPPVPLAL